jgi:hypothetical protein
MEMNSWPPGATRSTAAASAFHSCPVWCSTPHEYTTSNWPSPPTNAGSRMDPWVTAQLSASPANRRRSAVVAATESGS